MTTARCCGRWRSECGRPRRVALGRRQQANRLDHGSPLPGDNGLSLAFDPVDAIRTVEGVAAGRIDEARLADWFRSHIES